MYGQGFYDIVDDGARNSARAVVPLLLKLFDPRTVIDVGCGAGWWARTFHEAGCEVLGIDGSPNAGQALFDLLGAWPPFNQVDLTKPLAHPARFDLAVCLEVGEHLPEEHATQLVESVCQLAPTVIWSAAIPGQGGEGHVNEQWPEHWVRRFRHYGYVVSGALRLLIWDNGQVEPWYRQNLLVASIEPERYPDLFETPFSAPLPLVHPVLYAARTGARL